MTSQKSKWIVSIAAIACIGCCTIPLFTILVGASGISFVALLDHKNLDLLVCLLPLLIMLVGYFMYKRQQAKNVCCNSPSDECSKTQCTNKLYKRY